MFKPEDNYRRIYRITYAKKNSLRPWWTLCVKVRYTLHDSCLLSIFVHRPNGPFSVRISDSTTSARVCRGFTFGWNGNWRARACTRTHRAEHAMRLRRLPILPKRSGATFEISDRSPTWFARILMTHLTISRLTCAIEQSARFYAAVLSLLETNAVFYVDTSQLEQPFVYIQHILRLRR